VRGLNVQLCANETNYCYSVKSVNVRLSGNIIRFDCRSELVGEM